MKGNNIKIALLKRGIKQIELAQRLGLSLSQVNMIINGRRKTRWIQEAIAKELQMKVCDLFPTEERRLAPRRKNH
jgi:transcriptional regulator with XRE-family HTH domain